MTDVKLNPRAERRILREKMRSAGLGYREIATELARRYNFRPRRAWREAYGWSLREAAHQINTHTGETGLDPSAIAGMTGAHLCEYEQWPGDDAEPSGRRPTPYLLALLSSVYECEVTELIDLADRDHLRPADLLILDKYRQGQTRPDAHAVLEAASCPADRLPVPAQRPVRDEAHPFRWLSGQDIRQNEWPAWFGVRLAHLMSVIDGWSGPITRTDSMQAFLDEEILLFDTTASEVPGPDQTAYGPARRQVLVSLAALPVALTVSNLTETRNRSAARSLFLSRCAASITACWHLLRGSDLLTVGQILETYLLPLEGIAYRQSKCRQAAAGLASQAHRISGIIALHRNQLRRREHHDTSSPNVPDRIRFEIVNGQAKAAVLLNDIDAFETHLQQGLDGAMLLGSGQRMRELQQACRDAQTKWPNEDRVNALAERLRVSPSDAHQETLT